MYVQPFKWKSGHTMQTHFLSLFASRERENNETIFVIMQNFHLPLNNSAHSLMSISLLGHYLRQFVLISKIFRVLKLKKMEIRQSCNQIKNILQVHWAIMLSSSFWNSTLLLKQTTIRFRLPALPCMFGTVSSMHA